MKNVFFSLTLLAILALGTSFNIFESPAAIKTTANAPGKCGPWFTVYNNGMSVNRITLTYVETGIVVASVINPTFPYSFPQSGNGEYIVTVTFSSVPPSGVYVAAGDQCGYTTKRSISVNFVANVCVNFDIVISNFACG